MLVILFLPVIFWAFTGLGTIRITICFILVGVFCGILSILQVFDVPVDCGRGFGFGFD